jgi:epoxyqueuosine reductase QueG
MEKLTRDFIAYAESQGTQMNVILSEAQLVAIRNQAPERFKKRFDILSSNDLKGLPVAVIVGVFGYDDVLAKIKSQEQNVGLTGSHQNYWKIAEDTGKKLLKYLEDKGFNGMFNGEGKLPVKYVLNSLGIGRYGKNSILYVEGYGSYINNWVELFTDAPLEPTEAGIIDKIQSLEMCNKCNACIENCPTGAIYEAYRVDEKKCITHLTHCTDVIPRELFEKMDNWIWGCNVCQRVCPANAKIAPRKRHPRAMIYHPGPNGLPPAHKYPFPKLVTELVVEYNTKYLKNVLIALGNSGKSDDLQYIEVFARTKKGIELKEYCLYAADGIKKRMNT